jgi:hypothetical protein
MMLGGKERIEAQRLDEISQVQILFENLPIGDRGSSRKVALVVPDPIALAVLATQRNSELHRRLLWYYVCASAKGSALPVVCIKEAFSTMFLPEAFDGHPARRLCGVRFGDTRSPLAVAA